MNIPKEEENKIRKAIDNLEEVKDLEVKMIEKKIQDSYEKIAEKMICAINMPELKPSDIYIDEMKSLLKEIMPNLLHDFWQRTSDACPLECSEHEKQEKLFKEWVFIMIR